MKVNYEDFKEALVKTTDERHIDEAVIRNAVCEAISKAYLNEINMKDLNVVARINEETHNIDLYQLFNVVDEVTDDEKEMDLEEAKEYDPDAVVGETIIELPVEIESLSRGSVDTAKSIIRQQIREAEKAAVYEEYKSKKNDLVYGTVDSYKEHSVIVNIGKTLALLPGKEMISGEVLPKNTPIQFVIIEVNNTKSRSQLQVVVSRASAMLVRRLFEREVQELNDGTVEIKAMGRIAGERTKMAVYSSNPDVDPCGACIGKGGQRVNDIKELLSGEKIDIFEWSDNDIELIRNALAPAEIDFVVKGYIPKDSESEDDKKDGYIVVVQEDQTTLAIGKNGSNVKCVSRLLSKPNHQVNVDIKTREQLEELGMDVVELEKEAQKLHEEFEAEAARKEVERREREAREAEEKRLASYERLMAQTQQQQQAEPASEEVFEPEYIPEEMQDVLSARVQNDIDMMPEEPEEAPAEEKPAAKKETKAPAETSEDKDTSKKHVNLEEVAAKNTYVSKFEDFADSKSQKEETKKKSYRKKKTEEPEEKRLSAEEIEELKQKAQDNRPIYTEEELAEIEAQEYEDEYDDDIDYDEYEDYYDDEDN